MILLQIPPLFDICLSHFDACLNLLLLLFFSKIFVHSSELIKSAYLLIIVELYLTLVWFTFSTLLVGWHSAPSSPCLLHNVPYCISCFFMSASLIFFFTYLSFATENSITKFYIFFFVPDLTLLCFKVLFALGFSCVCVCVC